MKINELITVVAAGLGIGILAWLIISAIAGIPV